MDELIRALQGLEEKLDHITAYVEKNLHIASIHHDLYSVKNARAYYPLNDNWALTHLDTGHPFFVNTADRIVAPWIIMGGHWEPSVDRVLTSYAKPGMHILDIGAHCGYYTIKLANKVGAQGAVTAFEPNPDILEFCRANIKLNGFSGWAELREIALSDHNGTARMISNTGQSAGANIVGDHDAGRHFDVRLCRLDDVEGLEGPIDLIKLDAEGNEAKILRGARKLFERSPECALVVELSLNRWERQAEFSELLLLGGGGDREIFGIHEDGTIEQMDIDHLKAFINHRDCKEEYVIIALMDNIMQNIPELVRS